MQRLTPIRTYDFVKPSIILHFRHFVFVQVSLNEVAEIRQEENLSSLAPQKRMAFHLAEKQLMSMTHRSSLIKDKCQELSVLVLQTVGSKKPWALRV